MIIVSKKKKIRDKQSQSGKTRLIKQREEAIEERII